MDIGRNIWLDRARMVCWAGGEGFCRNADLGVEIGTDFGGVWGRMGTARPTSMWPRAFSTFGRLNRLNKDILEDARSNLGTGVAVPVLVLVDGNRDAASRRFVVDRLKRHRELDGGSAGRLRALPSGLSRNLSFGGMVTAAV